MVGISSSYFHATLSFAGMIVDEFSILFVMMAGIGVWLPKFYMPRFVKMNRSAML